MYDVPSESPIPQAPRLNELVFGLLRTHIVGGVIEQGLILHERDIVDTLGVGRAPARMALQKLEEEKLIRKRRGHGFEVTSPGKKRVQTTKRLNDVPLILPQAFQENLRKRNWRQHIYPLVERRIASCLVFGRFLINQSALAEYFGVSRTIAHEVLMSLERVGFVRQGGNARWYAGPLTVEGIKESYELRLLLEPRALIQAAPHVRKSQLLEARQQVIDAQAQALPDPEVLNEIELRLHAGIVHKCTNQQMRNVLRNCQLPIIVTYGTVVRNSGKADVPSGIPETLADHRTVIELLIDNKVDTASAALQAHIRRGGELSLPHFENPPPLAPEAIPPYMVPAP